MANRLQAKAARAVDVWWASRPVGWQPDSLNNFHVAMMELRDELGATREDTAQRMRKMRSKG